MNIIDKIISIHYHRNGVRGEGFYVVEFEAEEESMVGIVFAEDGYVAILDITDVSQKWRGDVYESELRKAIAEYEKLMTKTLKRV